MLYSIHGHSDTEKLACLLGEGTRLFQLLRSVLEELNQQREVAGNLMQVHLNGEIVCQVTGWGGGVQEGMWSGMMLYFN